MHIWAHWPSRMATRSSTMVMSTAPVTVDGFMVPQRGRGVRLLKRQKWWATTLAFMEAGIDQEWGSTNNQEVVLSKIKNSQVYMLDGDSYVHIISCEMGISMNSNDVIKQESEGTNVPV
uniref:Uncharacterized protein n=1 Tax=Arundo donax TaxID=35708 RepID=A0A0A8XZV9_ARUDO